MAKDMNTTGTIKSPSAMSEAQIDAILTKMGTAIKNSARRKVRLPPDPLNPKQPREVGLNGYFFKIPCGEDVSLPEPIIEVLRNAGVL